MDNAAANAPAATKAITQSGKFAISGFAKTIMSLSTTNSFLDLSATYWMCPSLFLSVNVIKPVVSHFLNHTGTSA